MTDAAKDVAESALPEVWREHYAALAAQWVREKGTLPPSLEALAAWAAEPTSASLEEEIAYLEGRGPSPDPCPSESD